jgi:hypothetical protein
MMRVRKRFGIIRGQLLWLLFGNGARNHYGPLLYALQPARASGLLSANFFQSGLRMTSGMD